MKSNIHDDELMTIAIDAVVAGVLNYADETVLCRECFLTNVALSIVANVMQAMDDEGKEYLMRALDEMPDLLDKKKAAKLH